MQDCSCTSLAWALMVQQHNDNLQPKHCTNSDRNCKIISIPQWSDQSIWLSQNEITFIDHLWLCIASCRGLVQLGDVIQGLPAWDIYFIWPISAILINGATKFYASRIKQKMTDTVWVFTIMSHPQSDIVDDKFSFSINSVLGIPLMIMFAVFSSIASRKIRLLFFYPFQMMLMSVVLPSIVIL